jgi:methionyl-tRNA formyltransferase
MAEIVLLARPSATSRVVYHFLREVASVSLVVLERPVPSWKVALRRTRKLGWGTVFGQAAFQVLVLPWLKRAAAGRLREIHAQHGLRDAPLEGTRVLNVPSANSPQCQEALRQAHPAIVVVNGTRILSKALLECVPATFLNMHAGITPAYRGVHGGYWALVEQRPDLCGVTVHVMDAGIDTGRVLAQALIHPEPRDNFTTYPWLQLAAGLPLLAAAITRIGSGEVAGVDPLTSTSRLWSHPTLWEYCRARIALGVK